MIEPASRIVDADCHILEPPDIWTTWLPRRFREKAPRLVKDVQGGDAWLTSVGGDPDPIGLTATPGMPFDEFRWFGVTYEEARPGCYNGTQRLSDMDIDGVSAEVLFPPQRTMSHFLGDDDDDFVLAGVKAYNDFLFEEFCAPDPARLIGLAQIPSLGIDVAVDGLRQAKARGAKGVLISNWPSATQHWVVTTIPSGRRPSTKGSRSRCTSTSSAGLSAPRAGRPRRAPEMRSTTCRVRRHAPRRSEA